jgi:hypothetical protein
VTCHATATDRLEACMPAKVARRKASR